MSFHFSAFSSAYIAKSAATAKEVSSLFQQWKFNRHFANWTLKMTLFAQPIVQPQ